jgi:glycosyltransferase involved in cell wall biosynthesis
MKKKVTLVAPVYTASGYGAHGRDIAWALIALQDKYDLKIVSTAWGNTPTNALDKNNPNDLEIIKRIVPKTDSNDDIFIQLTIPNEFVRCGKYNIGFTAGIETDMCAPKWIEGCNNMDMLLTTSKHSLDVIQDSVFDKVNKNTNQLEGTLKLRDGLRKEILFEGVDTTLYTNKMDPDENMGILEHVKEDFCYLFVGHWLQGSFGNDRKNVGAMIKVFFDTFKRMPENNRPALILKTSGGKYSVGDLNEIQSKIRSILDGESGPNIYILHGDLSDGEMNNLYNDPKVKAMISFTKGEGYGRPLAEFSVTGKPIIASNWSGQLDFLHPKYSSLLPGRLEQVDRSVLNEWFIQEAKWFTVDYMYSAGVIADVFTRYKKHKENAEKQRVHTLTHFSFEKMVDKLEEILDSIDVNQSSNQPKLNTLKLPKLKLVE